jgi:GNAT superfamily N-acetyltransferase
MIGLIRHKFFELDGEGAQIAALVVTESGRRKGTGRDLVVAGEAWAAESGCHTVWVSSGLRRQESHEFYRRLGYGDSGLRFTKEL